MKIRWYFFFFLQTILHVPRERKKKSMIKVFDKTYQRTTRANVSYLTVASCVHFLGHSSFLKTKLKRFVPDLRISPFHEYYLLYFPSIFTALNNTTFPSERKTRPVISQDCPYYILRYNPIVGGEEKWENLVEFESLLPHCIIALLWRIQSCAIIWKREKKKKKITTYAF